MLYTVINISCNESTLEENIFSSLKKKLQLQAGQLDVGLKFQSITYDDEFSVEDYENPIMIFVGDHSIDKIKKINEKTNVCKCIIWISTYSTSEENYKILMNNVDILIKPKQTPSSIVYNGKAKEIQTTFVPFDIDIEKLKELSQTSTYQDIEQQTHMMSQPKKTCWRFLFTPQKPTAIAALLGGSSLSNSPFNSQSAWEMAKKITTRWPSCYIIVITDVHTPADSRNSFTQALERFKKPYILYDQSKLENILAYIAHERGEIVLTEECLWKLSITTNVDYVSDPNDCKTNAISNPIHDEEEIRFDLIKDESEPRLSQPTTSSQRDTISPYIHINPKGDPHCKQFAISLAQNDHANMLESQALSLNATKTHATNDPLESLLSMAAEYFPREKELIASM